MTYYHDSDAEEERWNARMKEIKTEMSRQQRYYQAMAENEEQKQKKEIANMSRRSPEHVIEELEAHGFKFENGKVSFNSDIAEDLNGCLWVLIGFVAIMAVCYYSYIWMGGSIIW